PIASPRLRPWSTATAGRPPSPRRLEAPRMRLAPQAPTAGCGPRPVDPGESGDRVEQLRHSLNIVEGGEFGNEVAYKLDAARRSDALGELEGLQGVGSRGVGFAAAEVALGPVGEEDAA